MEVETGNRDDTSAEEVLPLDARWYAKAELINDNVKKLYQNISICHGFSICIGEMMVKFKGGTEQNNWMKDKSVKEGDNLWTICSKATGLCYKIIPAAIIVNTH